MRFGVVVEGDYDAPVLKELIPRIRPEVTTVVARVARGKSRFMGSFPALLATLAHGSIVDRAIAVRDSDDQVPSRVEQDMQRAVTQHVYPFRMGVGVHATKRETETWLLADVTAVNLVASRRQGRDVPGVAGTLEDIRDAKERFKRLLYDARLLYEEGVLREIARVIDLDVLRSACPSFRLFEEKVLADH